MKLTGLFMSLIALTLAACHSMPTQAEIASADYGSYPENYEEIVKNYYENVAKDPESLKFRSITKPQQRGLGNRIDGMTYGYFVCAEVNGKNSFGGYTGFSRDGLLIRNGSVVTFAPKGEWWGRYICN